MENIIIPAHPIPNMALGNQMSLDQYFVNLENSPARLNLRSILMILIDYEIIYAGLGQADRQRMDDIRNQARQRLEGAQDYLLVEYIMGIVAQATRQQRIIIFNRITNLFRGRR
jgi:hypothetical protein